MNTDAILKDKYALVTGGGRGIGRAISEILARNGCNVGIVSRTLRDAEKAAGEIGESCRVETFAQSCDVSNLEDVGRMFEKLRLWSQTRLDVLVCCAGYAFIPEIWETPLHNTPREVIEAWYSDVYKTDTIGSVFCTYEALPVMMRRKTGSIVYIASTPAIEGYKGTPYTVAKAAVIGLMKDVAQEYGKYNIRANALALGNIETPATFGQLAEEDQTALALEAPLGRWGKAEEVGRAALFLASNLSSFITGQTMIVDGGTVRR